MNIYYIIIIAINCPPLYKSLSSNLYKSYSCHAKFPFTPNPVPQFINFKAYNIYSTYIQFMYLLFEYMDDLPSNFIVISHPLHIYPFSIQNLMLI